MATDTTHHNPHRLSILDPSEYTHVGEFYQGSVEEIHHEYRFEHLALDRALGSDWPEQLERHRNGGCAHCGANFAYGSVFTHPDHGLVAIGHTCASGRFTFNSNLALRAAQAKRRGEATRQRALRASEFRDSLSPELIEAFKADHDIIRDIRLKGEKYGSISDRQASLVLKLAAEVAEREARREALADRKVGTVPQTDERLAFEGRIVSIKEKINDWTGHSDWKMLVEVEGPEGGYRIYGSLPAALDNADTQPGDRVAFSAKVERSAKDDSFGFFKRPTKARKLS